MKKSFLFIVLSLLVIFTANAQLKTIKVACIGNSITYGVGVDANRMVDSYPAQLGQQLSYQWNVNNFGKGWACAAIAGAVPYIKQPEFAAMMAYLPDVVIMKLGTNDGLSEWSHKADFEHDYLILVDSIAHLSSKPKIYLCRPTYTGIVENKNIQDTLYPIIQKIAISRGLEIIDLYTPLANNLSYFGGDKLHPNKTGYGLLAKAVSDKLMSGSQSVNLSKTILANKMTVVSGTGTNLPAGYIGNAASGLKVSLGTIDFTAASYNHVFVKSALAASTVGTFDFYLDTETVPFAKVKAMATGGALTFLTSTMIYATPITGSHEVFIVWNGQSSNLLMAGFDNYVDSTPLIIPASKMTSLSGCILTSDYIRSAVDGSSIVLGDSIDFGNGEVYNKISSNMSLILGGLYGQRSGELDFYIDNQTTPFASVRKHMPVVFDVFSTVSKRFDKITGKHKVKIVWDWYVANIKNITFSYETGPVLTPVKEIKIACIGNSITEGTDAGDRVNKGYVGLVEQMMGENYQVRNYGKSGSTVCRGTYGPWVTSNFSTSAQNFQPDIVTIALGTNDSQTSIWNTGTFATNFKMDYVYLVDLFANLTSKPKVYVCIPPPIFPSARWLHQPDVLANDISTIIYDIAKEKGLEVINFYAPLINHNEYYAAADQLHPLAAGHVVMANQVYKTLTGNTVLIWDALTIQKSQAENMLTIAVIGTTPGTYLQSAKDALINSLNKAKTLDTFVTQIQIDQMTFELSSALKAFKSSLNYTKNTLLAGDYFIKKAGTNLFWTNTGANKANINYTDEKPVFKAEIVGSNDQLFNISILSNNLYKIVSKSDVSAYINEVASIRRNVSTFSIDWNSFNILFNGSAYAVQATGKSASKGFWILKSEVVTASGVLTLNPETNFVFDLVKSIPTAVQNTNERLVKIISIKDGIQIIQDKESVVSVYNAKGSMMKTISISGNATIAIPSGLYIVKVKNEGTSFNEKILVK